MERSVVKMEYFCKIEKFYKVYYAYKRMKDRY